jgi:hypothetical protein
MFNTDVFAKYARSCQNTAIYFRGCTETLYSKVTIFSWNFRGQPFQSHWWEPEKVVAI